MTTDAKTSQAREIYLQAVRMDDDQARQSYLDEACGWETKLRTRVDKLLRANAVGGIGPLAQAVPEQESDFFAAGDRVAGDSVAEDTGAKRLSKTKGLAIEATDAAQVHGPIDVSTHPPIGRYKLLEEIAHGGMGTVYMAQQTEPVKRKVALKVIKPGMDSKDVVSRFEAERQALAMMDHANIAKVLDGGSTAEGRPYFVMELVRGVPLTEFCRAKKLGLHERLELFIDICKAVQHAHQKGIIHRDLKPSNLLVTMHDHLPVVKVIDFGVAKALHQELTERTLFTHFSQMIGTPLYMAPEQAQMSGLDIDTRSDIYSLGVILYELLTGTTPFDRDTMSSLGMDGIRKLLNEQDPQRPSVRVSTLKAEGLSTVDDSRTLDSEIIAQQLKRELDWIVMKALEKDRTRRYESANAFAEDVQRYLDDEPVEACPPTLTYRLSKYAKKHKGLLTMAALLIAMLATSTAVSTVFAFQANAASIASEESEQDAKTAQEKAEAEKEKAVAAQKQSDANFATALAAIDKLLEHVSASELAEIPKSQPIRRKMLEDVLEFYESSSPTLEMSQQLKHRAATTWMKLGHLSDELGDFEAARRANVNSMRQINSLVEQYPDNVSYRQSKIDCLKAKGFLHLHDWRQPAEYDLSKAAFGQVREEVKELRQAKMLGRFPEISESYLAVTESRSFSLSGFITGLAGKTDEHRLFVRQAYAIAKEQDFRGAWRATIEIQMALIEKSDNPAVAAEHFREAINNWTEVIEEKPTRQDKVNLVQAYDSVASFFESRDPALAQEYGSKGVDLAEQIYADFPSIDIYGSLMWMVIRHQLDREDSLETQAAREKYKKYDKYLLIESRSEWHFRNRMSAQFLLQNHSQVLADMNAAAAVNPQWRISTTWISPKRIAACTDEKFRQGVLGLANDLVKADSGSVTLRENRASVLMAMGRGTEALDDLRFITRNEIPDYYSGYQAALLVLVNFDKPSYLSLCQKMLHAPFGNVESANGTEAHFTSWTCALAPDAIEDYESVIQLARQAVEQEPTDRQYLNGLGAILMRAGQYDEAQKQLEKAIEAGTNDNTSLGYIHYFLAMTRHALGDTQEAQARLSKANEIAESELSDSPSWNRRLTLELLRKEAESQITPPQNGPNVDSKQ